MAVSKVVVVDGNNLSVRIDRGVVGPTGPIGPSGGPTGPTGATGPQGTGVEVKGYVATVADLPMIGNTPGDSYIVG
jgi:hypothetical protein